MATHGNQVVILQSFITCLFCCCATVVIEEHWPFNKLLSMGSYDSVTVDKFGKNGWPFFWPLFLAFGSFLAHFWTRFGLLAKSRSGNPAVERRHLGR